MASTFESAHAASIEGSLTTVDRLIVHGHIISFFKPQGFPAFLLRQGIRPSDFGAYVRKATQRLTAHIGRVAEEAKRPLIWQPGVVHGKEQLAREIAKRDGVTQGLVCVFSTLETAMCFAMAGQRGIVRQLRKCLHYYVYLIDPELGFIH